jgi:transposase-like protein
MPRTRPAYPSEVRQQMIELVRAARAPEKLGRQFNPTAQTIRHWVEQNDLEWGQRTVRQFRGVFQTNLPNFDKLAKRNPQKTRRPRQRIG